MTDREKAIVRELNHPLYTVEFLEEWKDRDDNVVVNAPTALQAMGANGYYEAIRRIAEIRQKEGEKMKTELEKQMSIKPQINECYYACPSCGAIRSIRHKHNYCHDCGQKLDWENQRR